MKRVGQVTAALAAGVGAVLLLLPRSRRRGVALVGRPLARSAWRDRGTGDGQLVEAVRARLADAFGASAADLQVTAHRRTVTLRGEVPRLGDIDACEIAARDVDGVDDVNNLLRLTMSRAGLETSSSPPPA